MDKGLKKWSTSTDVEPVHKATNPLQKAKRGLDDLEIKEKRKKQKIDKEKSDKKEIKKLRKSFKELTEIMKELQEIFQSKAHLPVISFGKKEPVKKPQPINECNFGNKDHLINANHSVFVRGFDTSLPRQQIKNALWKHFESYGKVETVYVPIECATGSSLGYAFVEMEEGFTNKLLNLDGSDVDELDLDVEHAKFRPESFGFDDFIGCKRCCNYMPWLTDRVKNGPYHGRFARYCPDKKWRTVGTPFSKIGRFTAIVGRVYSFT
ncbi:Nucleolin 2 [Cardamine amara subsp. amara]|uniref:Nucleolin 2 n=1 Tax=Cardamine amara subsp. amara TaxID=228776 RepID=A0ABD1BD84_CARAN